MKFGEKFGEIKSPEIEKLKSELEETKKTLQNVLQELDEIKSCKICMENFDDEKNAAVKLQCPHIFCEKCVKKIQEQRCAIHDCFLLSRWRVVSVKS